MCITNELEAAKNNAEAQVGFSIPEEVLADVLNHTARKMEVTHKPVDYMPILFENELTDYYMRMAVSVRGA